MTKADVINALAGKTGMAQRQAAEAVNLFLLAIREALTKGEKISLVGFGTFYVKKRRPRHGRNPRTGAKIEVPRKRVAAFKPGRSFRQLVNSANPTSPA